jgi:hypothetical protein
VRCVGYGVQKEPEVLYKALKPSEYAELSFFLACVPHDERRSVGLSSALIVELVRPFAAAQPPTSAAKLRKTLTHASERFIPLHSLVRSFRHRRSAPRPDRSDAYAECDAHSRGLRRPCLAGCGEGIAIRFESI